MAQKIPFQGRLLDNDRPFNGTATIDFSTTSPAWSETKTNVSVVDGYYSVVLGSTTSLPETLFSDSREVVLNITVNGEALSPVTLHSPILAFTGSNPVEFDSLITYGIDVLGESDNLKVQVGASENGYEAVILLKDSLDNQGAFIQTVGNESTGYTSGYMQLNGRESSAGALRSAVTVGGSIGGRANSYVDLYGGNFPNDGAQLLADLYASDTDETGTLNSTGYRRGGLDLYNYYGLPTHNIFSFESGSNNITSAINLSGSAGALSPTSTVFISSGDIAGSGGFIELNDLDGTNTIRIDGSDGGNAILNNRLNLSGDFSATGAGGIEVLDVGGTPVITLDGSTGNVTATGTVSSDRRLKKNIMPLENSLSNTLKMRGVSYNLKNPERSERKHIGVIAQEVEEIYPEFVYTDNKGMKSVNYAQMTAVLIEAIKELNAKVERLESENSDLKASLEEVKTLRSQMDNLMKMLGTSKAASK